MLVNKITVREGPSAGKTMGRSFIISVCEECGALVVDDKDHDDFHEKLNPTEKEQT